MPRPLAPMTARIEQFIRMEARGESADDILREIFHIDPATATYNEKNKAYQQMFRWRHRPDADAIWQDELKAVVRRCVPNAARRIQHQIDSDTEWLANKAANDVLTLAGRIGVVTTEEKALTVQVTGMPEIGSPDDA